jgi:uncharacterized protein YcbX
VWGGGAAAGWGEPSTPLLGQPRVDAPALPVGSAGDRAYALFDLDTGRGLTARRVPELLCASARFVADDRAPEITLPDGTVASGDAALSHWLGRRVALRASSDVGRRRYENPLDAEHDADWIVFDGAPGAFHDSARTRVSLVSTGTLGAWDRRRFRANVVLDGDGEDELVGSTISVGSTRLDVVNRIVRCVIVTRPQPRGIERELDVFKAITRDRDGCLAVGALVGRPGAMEVGDEVVPE